MISRRSLLSLFGGAVGTLPFASTFSSQAVLAPAHVVFDGRLSGARLLANAAEQTGLQALDSQGEPVQKFAGAYRHWLEEPALLVGITRYSEFMQIEDLARRQGKKLAFLCHSDAKGRLQLIDSLTADRLQLGHSASAYAQQLIRHLKSQSSEAVAWIFV